MRDSRWLLVFALLGAILAACATTPSRELTAEDKERILAEELAGLPPKPAASAPLPPAAAPVLPPPVAEQVDPLDERRVTVSGLGVPLRFVLTKIAERAGLRLAAQAEVELDRAITVGLEAVTLREALEQVLQPLDYRFHVDAERLVVVAYDTRGWTLSLPAMTLSTATEISNTSGSGSGSGSGTRGGCAQGAGGGGSTSAGTSGGGTTNTTQAQGSVRLGAHAEVCSQSGRLSSWDEIEVAVKQLLSPQGHVMVNRTLGLITVRDRPSRLDDLDRFLARAEAEAAQQIAVEVRAFEVQLTASDQYGIDWSRVWQSLFGNTAVGIAGQFAKGAASPLTLPLSLTVNEPKGLQIFITALSSQGKVRVLNQPSIRLMNGQPGVIQVGRVQSFLAESTDTISGTGGLSSSALRLGSVQDGVILPLTARVLGDEVILNVAPILTRVRQIRTITSGRASIEAPDVDSRAVQTTVRLKSGQTVVLGGLISSEARDDRQGLPWLLRSVPGFGWLFGRLEESSTRNELVLTITPAIVLAAGPAN